LVSGLIVDDLATLVREDHCTLASVSSEIGEGVDLPITRRNGHIVVVHGYVEDAAGQLTHILLHNPSGRSADLRADVQMPVERFGEAFSGRGIAIGPLKK
jgi:hypothetical protein